MQKLKDIICILMVFCLLVGQSLSIKGYATEDKVVDFPDANLERLIRETIGKKTGDIYTDELVNITELKGDNRRISNLEGIQYLSNLQKVFLGNNNIADISLLAGLKKLKWVSLYGNNITNIYALKDLENLQVVTIYGNPISNIEIIEEFVSKDNIIQVNISKTNVKDFMPIAELKSLIYLYLWKSEIKDISFIEGLANLEHVDLSDNRIEDITPLENKDKLVKLHLSNNPIKDYSPVAGVYTQLTDKDFQLIDAKGHLIKPVAFENEKLEKAILAALNRQVNDYITTDDLNKIKTLDLSGSDLLDISEIELFTNLESLNISGNNIEDISAISELEHLVSLDMRDNKIDDLTDLVRLESLKELYVADNPVADDPILIEIFDQMDKYDFEDYVMENRMQSKYYSDLTIVKEYHDDIVNHVVNKFTDLNAKDWYSKSIAYLVAMQIVDGYPDNTFKPNGDISIDAFLKMIIKGLGYELQPGSEYWALPYIQKATELGLIEENEYKNYRRQITRGEMAKITVRALDEDYREDLDKYSVLIKDFKDFTAEEADYILKIYSKGIVSGCPDGTYKPAESATRATAAMIILKILDTSLRNKPIIEEEVVEEEGIDENNQ